MSAKKGQLKFRVKNSPAFLQIIELVADRRSLQRGMLKAGLVEFDLASPVVDDHRKLRRLIQNLGCIADSLEAGEKSKSLDTRTMLRDGILQLTADGFAWLEHIEFANKKGKA